MKKQFEESSELDGYEDLKPEDKEKIDKAWEAGKVADEDIPETARKPAAEGEAEEQEAKPKKRARKPKDEAEGGAEKPKKSRAPKKKVCISFSLKHPVKPIGSRGYCSRLRKMTVKKRRRSQRNLRLESHRQRQVNHCPPALS